MLCLEFGLCIKYVCSHGIAIDRQQMNVLILQKVGQSDAFMTNNKSMFVLLLR